MLMIGPIESYSDLIPQIHQIDVVGNSSAKSMLIIIDYLR